MNQSIIGAKFERLTVIEILDRKNYKEFVKCKCDCGSIGNFYLSHLKNGRTKSCGCFKKELNSKKRPPNENIVNKKFNRLTVLSYSGYKRKQHSWNCVCVCGKIITITTCELKNGYTKSCGCLHTEQLIKRNTSHNQSISGNVSVEYTAWNNMKARCYNKNHEYYYNYGGRGIIVCKRWLESFENFYADMGDRPSPQHSLDRFPDKDGQYSPDNCRWATLEEQNSNKRTNIFIEYDGLKMTISQWTKYLGCGKCFIDYWLKRGKSFDFIVKHFKNGKESRNIVTGV